jgi:flavin reductase (DIM6/NTAB) family NADH-FMN oxidoreductase RutF
LISGDENMSVDSAAFKQSMRHWTTGIAIFAAEFNGVRHGMTVSSFASVTLDPPIVMASIQKGTRTHVLIDASGHFSVTLLAEDQQGISDRFAGRLTEQDDRFAGLETDVLVTGAPLIAGGLAYFDCKVHKRIDLKSHTIFLGEVLAVKDNGNEQPLVYYNRMYQTLQE